MPRNRMLSQKWFRDEVFSGLSVPARLTYFGLLTISDDYGNVEANPKIVRGQLWSLDDLTAAEVSSHLDEIADCGLGRRYEVADKQFLSLTGWSDKDHLAYQRVDRPSQSRNPTASGEDSTSTQRGVHEGSETNKKEKVKTKEKKNQNEKQNKKKNRKIKVRRAVRSVARSPDLMDRARAMQQKPFQESSVSPR